MSDYRSIFFEMAINALPKQFWLVKSNCGGEAMIAAPNRHLAIELGQRLWASLGYPTEPHEIKVESVPLVLCPESFCPAPCYGAGGEMKVVGRGEFFGDTEAIQIAIETARESLSP